jgi:hypothetical protein
VIDLRQYAPGRALATRDLHEARELDIFRTTVEEYETPVKQVFALLSRAEPRRAEAERAAETAENRHNAPLDATAPAPAFPSSA